MTQWCTETFHDVVELVQVALAGKQRLRREHLAEEAPDRPDVHRPAYTTRRVKRVREEHSTEQRSSLLTHPL